RWRERDALEARADGEARHPPHRGGPGGGGHRMSTPSAKDPFHVIAKPIGALCNIDCAYCSYLDKEQLHDHASRRAVRMADGVLERYAQQYLEAQPPGQEVNFSWEGGEPTLLGLPFFRRVVELQAEHARPGQRVTNSLQTNGMLLDDAWCEL